MYCVVVNMCVFLFVVCFGLICLLRDKKIYKFSFCYNPEKNLLQCTITVVQGVCCFYLIVVCLAIRLNDPVLYSSECSV